MGTIKRGIDEFERSDLGMGKKAIVYLKMGKGHKHRRKKEEDKISVRTFERIIRNHNINYVPNF